jgi:hypothetical protein
VDSGNVWRNAISKDFAFNQMKLTKADIRPLSTKTIGTAQDGASMRVLGEVIRDIHLPENTTGSSGRTFNAIQSDRSILKKEHKIDQIHSEDCIRFQ